NDVIARTHHARQLCRQLVGPGDLACRTVAAGAHAFDQHGGIDAIDRRFAGRVDGRHVDDVGVVEAGLELAHQVAQAGVAVRLGHRDNTPRSGFACGGEDGTDLDRVVGVV